MGAERSIRAAILACVIGFAALAAALPVFAQSLGSGQIFLRGLVVDMDTRPDVEGLQSSMTAVKDIPAGVVPFVGLPGSAVAPSIPAGATVRGELSGPSFGAQVIALAGAPNQGLALPVFGAAGLHSIRNVRLVDAQGEVIAVRDPAAPTIAIDVIDRLLVTQVTSRPLTAEEIREKGIVIDQDNFTVLNFTVGLTLGSEKVTIDLPVVVPTSQSAIVSLEAPQFTRIGAEAAQLRRINIPNFSLVGFQMRAPPEELDGGLASLIRPIDGIIVIPGNIGFLNEFFSVILQATNVGPAGSGLVVRDALARIDLPDGADQIARTGDDPLRVAETQAGGVQEELPLVDSAGTDDIAPQGTNAAEFLIEGLREGTHALRFDLGGDLFVPALGRTVRMTGTAAGVVQVRNPSFHVVLAHPEVVREGEEYSLLATVTNTSSTLANLFRLELPPRQLSGAALASGQSPVQTLDTLAPGQAATFEYRMVARTTGAVTGTVFLADEGVNGSFVLSHGIGDTGIPLSPDTLVLPQTVDYLPSDPDLVFAAVRMLGQAYSVATAPAGALPPEVARIRRPFVFDRAVKLAQVGLHVRFGESAVAATEDLLLDWLGNDLGRLELLFPGDVLTQDAFAADSRAFDALRRAADAGRDFGDTAGGVLGGALATRTLAEVQREFAEGFDSRPAFLSFGASARGSPVQVEIADDAGNRLGRLDSTSELAFEIPFGARLPLGVLDDLLFVGAPQAPTYDLAVRAPDGGEVDLSLVAPAAGGGAVVVTWPALSLGAGGTARLRVATTAANDFVLAVDADGDGAEEATLAPASIQPVVDQPPTVLRVSQWGKGAEPALSPTFESGDPLGRMVGVLFDEEVTAATGVSLLAYAVPTSGTFAAALQPDRRLAFVVLEKPIGPFVARTLTTTGVRDLRGNAMAPQTSPIVPDPDRGPGGRVSGQVVTADGRPVPFAPVRYIQPAFAPTDFCDFQDVVAASYQTDADGRFEIEFALQSAVPAERICTPDIWLNASAVGPTNHYKLEATDPESGAVGRASTRIQFDGQHQDVRVILRGAGAIEGRVFDEAGNALAGGAAGSTDEIQLVARNLSTGELLVGRADASGAFALEDIPVGNVSILAARASGGLTGIVTVNLPTDGARVRADVVLFPPFRFGTVSGRVLEADGRTPAANVFVQLAARVLQDVSLAGERTAGLGVLATATTDASGAFRFEDIPAGELRLRALRESSFEQVDAAGFLEEGATEDLVVVLPGGGGIVRGIVRDALGNVVPGATVAGGPTLTNAGVDGRFELPGLPLGTFTLYGQGFDSPSLGQLEVTTTGPNDVQEVVITLEPIGSVRGTVFEADGSTRRASQKVQLWVEGAVIGEAFTDAAGDFRFDRFPVGRYSVRAIRPDALDGGMAQTEIRFAGDVRDADVVFRGQGEIRGRVIQENGTPVIADVIVTRKRWKIVGDTGPIDNAQLGVQALEAISAASRDLRESVAAAIRDNGLDVPPDEFFLLVDETVAIRSDLLGPGGEVTGRFAFGGPATGGPFTVAALGPFLTPAEVRSEIPRTPDPTERIVDVGDIVLAPATSRIEGSVFLPDGETPAGPDVAVRLRSLDTSGEVLSAVGAVTQPVLPEITVSTDENGSFVFPLVLRGRFILTADTGVPDPSLRADTPAEMETETAAGRNVRLFAQSAGVAPRGGVVTADLRLEDVAGVRARVLDAAGSPVVGARVALATASGLDPDVPAAFTDAAGEVAFSPVPEGTFSLAASLSGDPRRASGTGVVPVNPPNGVELPITLQLGAVTTATGQILPAQGFGRVRGVVRRADGAPLESPAQVTVRAGGVQILTASNPDGSYEAESVPVGLVAVDAFEPRTSRRGSATGTLVGDGGTAQVDVRLVGLGTVVGEVFSSDGSRMLAGVDLELAPSGDFSAPLVSRSEPDGSFVLPGVPLGAFTLRASDFASGLSGQSAGAIARDGETVTSDVFLEPAGRITGVVYGPGVVVNALGEPTRPDGSAFPDAPVAAGAQVTLRSEALRFAQTVQADANGAFSSGPFLRVGAYEVIARAPLGGDGGRGAAQVRFDGDAAFAAVALRGTGTVSGVLLDSVGASPVAGASITLSSESEFFAGAVSRITGAGGSFEFPSVPVGRFSLSVRTNLQVPPLGGAASGAIERHGDAIAFADGDADALHQALRLQPAGSVTARVLIDDGVTPAEGAIAILVGGAVRLSRLVDATGALLVDGVPLGSYALEIAEPSSNGRARRDVSLVSNGQAQDFGTIALDAGRPRLLSASPFAGQVGASPQTAIALTFSEPIDLASVTGESLRVLVDGVAVSGVRAVAAGAAVVTFTPAARLPDLRLVTVSVRGDVVGFDGDVLSVGVRDLAGNSLGSERRFAFTTGDSAPPQAAGLFPADGAVEVPFGAVLRIEFDEPIDPTSVASFALVAGGTPVPGALAQAPAFGGRVLVFTPAASLAPDRLHAATLVGPVRDAEGNASQQPEVAWSFRTRDTLPPVIGALTAGGGSVLRQGGRVNASVALAAGSEDVVAVEWSLDGALVATDGSAPFAATVPLPGSLGATAVLQAIAIDEVGNRSPIASLPLAIAANQPPTLTVVGPADGVVSQGERVTVQANATDDVGVAQVALSATGAVNASPAPQTFAGLLSATASFSFDVPPTAAQGSTISVRVTATDALGLTTAAAPLVLTVADELAPVVTLTSPASGAQFDAGTTVSVVVRADDVGGVDEISFEATGAATGSGVFDVNPPAASASAAFSFAIPASATPGAAIDVRARARDAGGRSGERLVTLRVRDTVAPVVSIAPADGAGPEVEAGAVARLRVQASDAAGVVLVALDVPGVTAQQRTFPPRTADETFAFTVPATLQLGQTLVATATARDPSGNLGTSAPLALAVVDRTAPTAEITQPAAGARVAPGATFDVLVSASDVQGVAQVQCLASGAVVATQTVPIAPPAASASRTCSFSVPVDAPAGAPIDLDASASDASGNTGAAARVRVLVADVIAPAVVSIVPADGAIGVATNATVEVVFSEPVDLASFDAAFSLVGPGGAIAGASAPFDGGARVVFTPALALEGAVQYTATVGTALRDLAGNALAAPVTSSFRVGDDFVAPCITALEPAEGAETSLTPSLVARFSEPLDPASVVPAAVRLLAQTAGGPVSVPLTLALADSDTSIAATPAAALSLATDHVVEWTRDLRDRGGNRLRELSACQGGPDDPTATVAATQAFVTGRIAITEPVAGARAVEGQPVRLLATASAVLGLVDLTFRIDAQAVATVAPPALFTTAVAPLLAGGAGRLATVDARARLAGGIEAEVPAVQVDVRPLAEDSDGDGLANGDEVLRGTNPLASDSDGDGLQDGVDVAPLDSDADDDGISDGTDAATGPRLRSLEPQDGATNVSVRPVVIASFDEPLLAASVLPARFRLLGAGGAPIAATLALAQGGRALELRPDAALAFDTAFAIELSGELVDPEGNRVTDAAGGTFATRTSSFTTTSFGITSPADGAFVPEGRPLVVQASGSAALGIAAVDFEVDLALVASDATAPFEATVNVPLRTQAAWLALTAVARGTNGTELARSTIIVNVALALEAEGGILGVPLGGERDLLLRAPAPLGAPLAVALEAFDPALVGVPVGPVIMPAGARELRVPLAGLAEGATVVRVLGDGVRIERIAAVSALAPGQDLVAEAPPLGVAVQSPSAGQLVLAANLTRTVSLRLLAVPASANTPVVATSRDPAVATVVGPVAIPAGSTDATIVLATGSANGETTLTLRAGSEGRELRVIVGAATPRRTPPVLASPVGAGVQSPSAGQLVFGSNLTRTVSVRLLAAPASANTPVLATSRDPAVATVVGSVEILAGSTDALLTLATGSADGETTLVLRAGDEGRELRVIVGAAASSRTPPVVAPPVGIEVEAP